MASSRTAAPIVALLVLAACSASDGDSETPESAPSSGNAVTVATDDVASPDTLTPASTDAASSVPAVTEPVDTEPVETQPPRTAPTAVSAVFVEGGVTLTGEVLNNDQLAVLDDAAVARFGADNVLNEVQTSEAQEATPGADDRVAALAAFIGAVADGIDGAASLSDTGLVFVGTVPDDAAAAALEAAVESTDDFIVDVTSVLPPTIEEEIVSLQTELDELAAEINDTVEFPSDSADLTDAGRATLDKAIAVIQEFELPVVRIVGHTDDQGTDEANLDLSARRAAAVVDYIVASGVAAERLRSEGRGESEPIADNATEEGRQLNRRVELTALAEFE